MTQLPPPGWYSEPNSPSGLRWWDGTQWTEHVHPQAAPDQAGEAPATETTDDVQTGAAQSAVGTDAEQAAGGQADSAQPAAAATGPDQSDVARASGGWRSAAMLTAPVVQISQQGRVIESASVYTLADGSGGSVGQATQIGQRRGGRLLKAMTDMDRNLQVTIQFKDTGGAEVMTLLKPGGVGPQRFAVLAADGSQIGMINQKIRMVREAFDLVIGDQPAGALSSQNWIDRRFSALDASGTPFAVVHKRYEGYARAAFTSADEYVVEYAAHATPDQRAVALASAIAMDIALYQR